MDKKGFKLTKIRINKRMIPNKRLLHILLLVLALMGCSQPEKVSSNNIGKTIRENYQHIENLTKVEIRDILQFLLNQKERLIGRAKELGFNVEIITELYNEVGKSPENVEIIKLLKFHFDALMTKYSIDQSYKDLANSLAKEIKTIGPINETFFEDYNTFKRQTYRINHIVRVLNQELGTEIPEIDFSEKYFKKLQEVRKALGYSALIDSYNSLYKSAKKLPSDRDEDYWEFYKNLFLFMADVYFLEEKVAYRSAFLTTGKIASNLGLIKTQKVLGPKGYGLLLSEIHWMLRGEINEGWTELLETLRTNSVV